MRRPDPIRTDGSNDFAHRSMARRVPGIIQDVIDHNSDYPISVVDGLKQLRDDIAGNARLSMIDAPAPDYDLWAERFEPFHDDTWLGTEWFFSEMLAYRHLVAVTRFWDTLRDPFAPFKQEELGSDTLWTTLGKALQSCSDPQTGLMDRLMLTLWGNRIDMSLKDVMAQGTEAEAEHMLCNQIQDAVETLSAHSCGEIHVVMDNAGTEQALDFALVDFMLSNRITGRVVLHVKMQPVLVSDVIVADIHWMLKAMQDRGNETARLAGRLRGFMNEGSLRVVPDFFWNTDGRLSDIPPGITEAFIGADLVLMKGDANYRRITNDAVWPVDATFEEAAGGFPSPLLALRTLKSDTLVGVDPERQDRLNETEGNTWRVNGRYGIAQFRSI